ncbi:hypothetical protein cyc_00274 [Cyclospora cayetanensis]|uniref:Uncharacterized protein n=1 Tax=Cyclospora cayetanensis TaxID=88456 RepID=A0A1D3CTE6_9EIME|nr:hypothetical protein cyc_00274 [Cyclospora cayetanensis]
MQERSLAFFSVCCALPSSDLSASFDEGGDSRLRMHLCALAASRNEDGEAFVCGGFVVSLGLHALREGTKEACVCLSLARVSTLAA